MEEFKNIAREDLLENSVIDYDSDFEPEDEKQALPVDVDISRVEDWEVGNSYINPVLKTLESNFSNTVVPGPVFPFFKANISPYEAFSLIYDFNLLQQIAIQSDKYIREIKFKEKNTDLHKFYEENIVKIEPSDIKAYLAIILLMGIKKYPDQYYHWSNDKTFFDIKIKEIMPLNYYKTLKMAFHLCDNEMPNSDPFYKVQYLMSYLNEKFKTLYIPRQSLALDTTQFLK